MGRGTVGWSPKLAYAVGLIATDGNLGRRTATISMVSKDIDLLETMRRCLDVETQIRPHRGGYSKRCHRLAWRDRWRRINPRVHGSLPCKEERTLHLRSSLRVDRLYVSIISASRQFDPRSDRSDAHASDGSTRRGFLRVSPHVCLSPGACWNWQTMGPQKPLPARA